MYDCFAHEIITLKKQLQTFFNEKFKEFNLKSSEINLIHILSLNEGKSQAELAKRMDCDKAHIHRLIIKLVVKNIVTFSNKKNENSRNLQISLTENGKKIANNINKKLKEWKSTIINNISIEDLNATKRVLSQLIKNLDKENIDV